MVCLRMFKSMSEKSYRDRIKSDSEKEKQVLEDWMAGSGSKVLGVMVLAIGAWFLINLFW